MSNMKAKALKRIDTAAKDFLQDVAAMSQEQLDHKLGGTRPAIDYVYEVAFVNRRFAARVRGEDPGPWPFKGSWAVAPEEFQAKDAALAEFDSSVQEFRSAIESRSDEALLAEIDLPDGSKSSPLDFVDFFVWHLAYHDGQLNLVQAFFGDQEIHWG